jgi:hypothetical protein
MKVTGFSFIRNAIKYDYPIVEAIRSVLPLCDDFLVAVGISNDDTRSLVQNIDPQKIKIIDTVWDDSLREGGRVLALETDKAMRAVPSDSDWAFYIQGDEVLHEQSLENVRTAMQKYQQNKKVDGLLFKYRHFYGSYDYIGDSYGWYRREIRVIRNSKNIYSYRDAQGFRKNNNERLNVKPIDAYIHHYGWVKDPRAMQEKQQTFQKYWHNDEWIKQNLAKSDEFDYTKAESLALFKGSHPEVMKERIVRLNWKFDHDISCNKTAFRDRGKLLFEKLTGRELGYKNYRIV